MTQTFDSLYSKENSTYFYQYFVISNNDVLISFKTIYLTLLCAKYTKIIKNIKNYNVGHQSYFHTGLKYFSMRTNIFYTFKFILRNKKSTPNNQIVPFNIAYL